MLKYLTYAFILFGITSLTACKKDSNDPPVETPKEVIPKYLLKAIEWDNGVKSAFTYNADSTLKDVTSSFLSAASKTVYNWTGSKMTEVYQDESLYKNLYHYKEDGTLGFIMNTVKSGTSSTAYTLEFFHRPGGKLLDSMKYFRINEAGKHLQTISRYSYNNDGDVTQITTEGDGYAIIHTIDEWSPKVSFDPLAYISTTLDEYYAVYNYAVLSQSRKLPAKIYRVLKEDNKEPQTERIEENIYTLTGYRIDKVKTILTFPGIPANNRTVEAVYRYN